MATVDITVAKSWVWSAVLASNCHIKWSYHGWIMQMHAFWLQHCAPSRIQIWHLFFACISHHTGHTWSVSMVEVCTPHVLLPSFSNILIPYSKTIISSEVCSVSSIKKNCAEYRLCVMRHGMEFTLQIAFGHSLCSLWEFKQVCIQCKMIELALIVIVSN